MNYQSTLKVSGSVASTAKKHRIFELFLVVFLWIFIFNPPLVSFINLTHVLGVAAIFYLMLQRVSLPKYFVLAEFFAVVVYLYLLVVSLIHDRSGYFSLYPVYWIVDVLPISFAVMHMCKRRKIGYQQFEKLVILAACLEMVLVFLALLVPSIQKTFISMMIQYGYQDSYFETWAFRTYGLASNLQFSSALAMAITSLLCLNRMIATKEYRYFLLSILLVVAGYVNARTSLIVFLCGLMVILFMNRRMKHAMQIFKILLSVIIVAFCILFYFSVAESSTQVLWLRDGIYEILGLFSDDYKAHYSTFEYFLSSEKYTLPKNGFDLFFGTGTYILMRNEYSVTSDIGYINDMWLGGLTYLFVVYGCVLAFFRKLFLKHRNHQYVRIVLSVLMTGIAVSNMKGTVLSFNNVSTLVILICIFAIGGIIDESRNNG